MGIWIKLKIRNTSNTDEIYMHIEFFISTKNSCKQYKNMYTMYIEYK